ncbi:EscU/YscU/HrcU family type III secretion system export apparatus switch protein [Candidatus Raskinella chloraquaticus]|jgi:flagellar biosynthesis protein|uniref:Type III secretion protein n=1 Tax=Candidatus Raskinella chloraquaticus TaxID=1951219 RepID=A0A1W9I0G6_9HYPH|nr:MAG: hypothetical protein A4S15_05390 [Proteobacteria bacterium SG_bin8]
MSESPARKIAVALAYARNKGKAPTVIAKGEGHVADRIVEAAKANNISIDQNPVLAAALSQVELDQQIPVELYKAVAIVLNSVLRAAGKIPAAAPQAQQKPSGLPVS